ncbi:MAG TPA: DUF3175 domain-containing protein [Alphaproteobacteria bacterium]
MPAGRAARRRPRKPKPAGRGRYWSGEVTRRSFALDLDADVFTLDDPRMIAASLKRSAERSTRRKGTAFQSAMSMLNFYINRAGKNLPARRKSILNRAKGELREAFGRA